MEGYEAFYRQHEEEKTKRWQNQPIWVEYHFLPSFLRIIKKYVRSITNPNRAMPTTIVCLKVRLVEANPYENQRCKSHHWVTESSKKNSKSKEIVVASWGLGVWEENLISSPILLNFVISILFYHGFLIKIDSITRKTKRLSKLHHGPFYSWKLQSGLYLLAIMNWPLNFQKL